MAHSGFPGFWKFHLIMLDTFGHSNKVTPRTPLLQTPIVRAYLRISDCSRVMLDSLKDSKQPIAETCFPWLKAEQQTFTAFASRSCWKQSPVAPGTGVGKRQKSFCWHLWPYFWDRLETGKFGGEWQPSPDKAAAMENLDRNWCSACSCDGANWHARTWYAWMSAKAGSQDVTRAC